MAFVSAAGSRLPAGAEQPAPSRQAPRRYLFSGWEGERSPARAAAAAGICQVARAVHGAVPGGAELQAHARLQL